MPVFVPTLTNQEDRTEQVGASSSGADNAKRKTIFIRVCDVVRKTVWTKGNLTDLETLVVKTYGGPDNLVHMRSEALVSGFILMHSNWKDRYVRAEPLHSTDSIRDGTVVSVRDPLWQATLLLSSSPEGIPNASRTSLENCWQAILEPKVLPLRDRVDEMLNDPASSFPAMVIGVFILCLIVISTVTFCMETLPWYYDPDPGINTFFVIEALCIAIFTVEFVARLSLSRDRVAFCSSALNIIDFVAILPFYLEVMVSGLAIPGLSVLRVTRLARVFRLLKMSRDSLVIFGDTMVKSAKPLYMLAFLLCISMIMFSSIMYYAERGSFNLTTRIWERTVGWMCDFECTPSSMKLLTPYLECNEVGEKREMYFSKFRFGQYPDLCERVKEKSPFQSIPDSFWWAIATMTTVGYGDIYPTSVAGYILGGLTMLCGILVIALPITVIGSNFSAIYETLGKTNMVSHVNDTFAVAPPQLIQGGMTGATTPHLGRQLSSLRHAFDLDLEHGRLRKLFYMTWDQKVPHLMALLETELKGAVRNFALDLSKIPTEEPLLGTSKVIGKAKVMSMRRAQLQKEMSGGLLSSKR